MSGRDYGTGAPLDQGESGQISQENHYRECRIRLGAVIEADLIALYGVSSNTIDVWEKRGLKSSRPGSRKKIYLCEDVAEFLKRRETFPGKRRKPQRKGPKNGKKEGQSG